MRHCCGGRSAAITPQRAAVPLKLVPLVKENAGPSTIYGITMGVRPDEPQWKHTINKLIADEPGRDQRDPAEL